MKKIMIIDDELDILDVLERFLKKSGKFEIETFSNPIDALKEAKNKEYHLILSDIMMPQVNGIDILKEIKDINDNIKIILMTAYNTEEKEKSAIQFNVDGYIEKPFLNLKLVEKTITSLL